MFSALLLSLALLQGLQIAPDRGCAPTVAVEHGRPHVVPCVQPPPGPPMSVLLSDDFETSGSFTDAIYAEHAYLEVVSDSTLGGTKAAVPDGTPPTPASSYVIAGQKWGLSGALGTTPFTPSGRLFSVSACFDHYLPEAFPEDVTFTGPSGDAFIVGRKSPVSNGAYDSIFSLLAVGYDSTTWLIRLLDNSGHGSATLATVNPAFVRGVPHEIRVEVLMSTITGGTDAGGGSAASDGYIKVYIDGSLVIDYTGHQVGHYIANQGPPINWNTWANVSDPFTYVTSSPLGRLKNICIRDDGSDCGFTCEASEPPTPPPTVVPISPSDCCTTATTTTGTVPNPTATGILTAPIFACPGGGAVEILSDLPGLEGCWL